MASSDEVKKLAALARLALPDEKSELFAKEFDGILAYVGKLDELTLDTSGGTTVSVVHNVFRADTDPHEAGKYTDILTEQFPERDGNYLSVKQIISHD